MILCAWDLDFGLCQVAPWTKRVARREPSGHFFKRIGGTSVWQQQTWMARKNDQVKLKGLEGFGFNEANQRFRNLETCLAGCFSSGEELWQNQCSGAVVFVFVGWSSESFRLFTTLFFGWGGWFFGDRGLPWKFCKRSVSFKNYASMRFRDCKALGDNWVYP